VPNRDGVNRCNSDHHAEVKRNSTESSDTVRRGGGGGGDTVDENTKRSLNTGEMEAVAVSNCKAHGSEMLTEQRTGHVTRMRKVVEAKT
jgi:hypothetical protein